MQPSAFQPPKLPRILAGPLLLFIALMISNIIMKGPLPFSPGYQFPWKDFLTLIVAIFSIMEANKYVYQYLDKRLPFYQEMGKRLFWQCVGSFAVTLVLFSLIHLVRAQIWQEHLSLKDFAFYGFVAFSISIAFNGIHIIGYLLKLIKYKDQFGLNKRTSQILTPTTGSEIGVGTLDLHREALGGQTGTLAGAMGNQTLMMEPDSISWWHFSGGAVTLVRTDGVQFTTNYASFSEITDKLPALVFFHLNRQVIAHRTSIDSIQNGQNGQLTVNLKIPLAANAAKADAPHGTKPDGPHGTKPDAPHVAKADASSQVMTVVVSRYKRDAFRQWLEGNGPQ